MIVDDLAEASPYLAERFRGAHVVRVPFHVWPDWQREPDGEFSCYWTHGRIGKLAPWRADGSLDVAFARPPYFKVLITAEDNERGALLIETFGAFGAPIPAALRDQPVDWGVKFSLFGWIPDESLPLCLVAGAAAARDGYIKVSGCGDYGAGSPNTAANLAKMLFIGARTITAKIRACEYTENERDVALAAAEAGVGIDGLMDAIDMDSSNAVESAVTAFALMNCRNIRQEPSISHQKLDVARRRRGRLPLYRYHVLKLMPQRRTAFDRRGGDGDPLARHWVRGHFKTFTPERPLFGRETGTYWWSPHLAGTADRVVDKDYQIVPAPGDPQE